MLFDLIASLSHSSSSAFKERPWIRILASSVTLPYIFTTMSSLSTATLRSDDLSLDDASNAPDHNVRPFSPLTISC